MKIEEFLIHSADKIKQLHAKTEAELYSLELITDRLSYLSQNLLIIEMYRRCLVINKRVHAALHNRRLEQAYTLTYTLSTHISDIKKKMCDIAVSIIEERIGDIVNFLGEAINKDLIDDEFEKIVAPFSDVLLRLPDLSPANVLDRLMSGKVYYWYSDNIKHQLECTEALYKYLCDRLNIRIIEV